MSASSVAVAAPTTCLRSRPGTRRCAAKQFASCSMGPWSSVCWKRGRNEYCSGVDSQESRWRIQWPSSWAMVNRRRSKRSATFTKILARRKSQMPETRSRFLPKLATTTSTPFRSAISVTGTGAAAYTSERASASRVARSGRGFVGNPVIATVRSPISQFGLSAYGYSSKTEASPAVGAVDFVAAPRRRAADSHRDEPQGAARRLRSSGSVVGVLDFDLRRAARLRVGRFRHRGGFRRGIAPGWRRHLGSVGRNDFTASCGRGGACSFVARPLRIVAHSAAVGPRRVSRMRRMPAAPTWQQPPMAAAPRVRHCGASDGRSSGAPGAQVFVVASQRPPPFG